MKIKNRNQLTTLIVTAIAMITLSIWQRWDAFMISSLYWYEGVIISLFISLALFFYENKQLGVLILLSQAFLYWVVGYLLFDEYSNIFEPFALSGWLIAFTIICFYEAIFFWQITQTHGAPFTSSLKGKSDPIVVRSVMRYSVLMAYVVIQPLFPLNTIWSVVLLIVLMTFFEWRFSFGAKYFTKQ